MTVATKQVVTLLDAAAATGAGNSFSPSRLERAFEVTITGTATVSLQASMDNVNWFDLRSSTASEQYTTTEPWPFVRGNLTAYTSGAVTIKMAT